MVPVTGENQSFPRSDRSLVACVGSKLEIAERSGRGITIGIGQVFRNFAKLFSDTASGFNQFIGRIGLAQLGHGVVIDSVGSNGAKGILGDFAQFVPGHCVGAADGTEIDAVRLTKFFDPGALLLLFELTHRPIKLVPC